MATVCAKVFKHHLKTDGSYNVKIRIFHKNEKKYIDTEHYVTVKQLFKNLSIKDQVVHFDVQPVDVTIQDKPNFEQINMINQLDEEDRTMVFKIIDTMLTKKKFKDFFNNNVAAL